MCVGFCGFFFFKQKTAYEMRISDWSSDVCSSDLAFRGGWVHDELYAVRDSRPAFRWGLLAGTVYSGIELWLRGRTPWTLRHRHADHETLRQASASKPIAYPKPDGVLTFDRLSSVYLSNTNHEENQPSPLKLRDPSVPIRHNLPLYEDRKSTRLNSSH